MRAILPGRPQSKPQAFCTCLWDDLRIIAYLSGNTIILLGGPQKLLQTIYVDDVELLEAIAIDERSGNIAVSGGHNVLIYRPVAREEGVLRWSQQYDVNTETKDTVVSLSWGSPEELLAGGEHLYLWSIPHADEPSIIWQEKLPNAVRLACFSHDAGLIASTGHHDRLVKIWRRLSYEVDSTRFDVSYLPHPRAVTKLHWRKPWHAEQSLDNLLYTFCSDDRIRIWAHSEPHTRSMMQLVAEIDMQASIQPRMLPGHASSKYRYGFVIDSRDFSRATENAVQISAAQNEDHALEHLIEIASRSPEICIVLDDLGHISAWGLENAGYKNRQPTTIFNVVHVQGLQIPLRPSNQSLDDFLQFYVFAGGASESSLTLLVHYFHGRVDWYDSQISELFDPVPIKNRVQLISSWTGHDASIKSIKRSPGGRTVISYAESSSAILWKEPSAKEGPPLDRHGMLRLSDEVNDQCFLNGDKVLVVLNGKTLAFWNIDCPDFELLGIKPLEPRAEPVLLLAPKQSDKMTASVIVVYADLTAELWVVNLQQSKRGETGTANGYHPVLKRVRGFGDPEKEACLITVAPASILGSVAHSRVILSLSSNGVVQSLVVNVDVTNETADWHRLHSFDTGIANADDLKAGPHNLLAIIDSQRTSLTLWDFIDGFLDFEWHVPENDTIEQLEWTSTAMGEPLLAVGSPYHVILFGPVKHGRLHGTNSWIRLTEIRIRDFATHSLGGLTWLRNGDVAIGSGTQIFVYEGDAIPLSNLSARLRMSKATTAIKCLAVVDSLNSVAPVFHPEFLLQLVAMDRFSLVRQVLVQLDQKLKFFSEGDTLPSGLDYSSQDLLQMSQPGSSTGEVIDDVSLADIKDSLVDKLRSVFLEQLSPQEQASLIERIETLASLEGQRKSLDAVGYRYLCLSRMPHEAHDSNVINWREIVFASHSTSQDILVDLVTRASNGKLTWESANRSGLFLWLSDHEALRGQMEIMARNEYTKNDDRNPVDCSLYYLALGKKSVLQGLWRMTVGVREKEGTLKLLANNFQEPRWRNTALKNAYALLSKRRFEYAAAFFLLGGSLKDAVNVCVHQLGQLSLGIAIASAYEGDGGPVMERLLRDVVLPNAADTGNRWMATWAFDMLGEHDKAIQALVRPLQTLIVGAKSDIPGTAAGTRAAKSWSNNEPCLAVHYKRLRDSLIKKNKWVDIITPKEEWKFVLRCARQYIRLGCDLLAVGLLRDWEFVKPSKAMSKERPTNLITETIKVELKEKNEEKKKTKPPPTQFQEPSASSLLDSFGF